ncbi:hypothetical protein F4703DRAFT_1919307 [Phycomyces blakesleeanus]
MSRRQHEQHVRIHTLTRFDTKSSCKTEVPVNSFSSLLPLSTPVHSDVLSPRHPFYLPTPSPKTLFLYSHSTTSPSPHPLHHIHFTTSTSPHPLHHIHFTTSTSPHPLHHIHFTTSTSPHPLHHIHFTTSTSPHPLHHIHFTTSTSPHPLHHIPLTASLSPQAPTLTSASFPNNIPPFRHSHPQPPSPLRRFHSRLLPSGRLVVWSSGLPVFQSSVHPATTLLLLVMD